MLSKLAKFVVGSRNDRLIKNKKKIVMLVNKLTNDYKQLTDKALQAKTQEFRARLADGEVLNNLIPEAFSVVREASVRVFNMSHFDVQLIGAMILNDGRIAEMKTGEGKTLMATLSAYLNALPAKGVHIVTVNDYLAARDAEWMGQLYSFLGLTTGVIVSELDHDQRKEAYEADITYGTNNEFGFDYLRDNMAFSIGQKVQRGLYFAIVDEVDSILIDEARTPLIISGPTEESTEIYLKTNDIVPFLTKVERQEGEKEGEEKGEGHYTVDEKSRQLHLTEAGHEKIEHLLVENGLLDAGVSLYEPANIRLMHYLNASLKAHALFQRDVDYIVQGNEVIIVDEYTGRIMPGRRWSEGLHQAMEAKEGVKIQSENQTLASITFQNYFRLYEKLSGMTGTADTESFELNKIYGLEVVVIPTHREMSRKDKGDLIFLTAMEKYHAITEDIKDCVKRGQPVLVGTTSVENSELISNILSKEKIKHEVLNAKQHEREAHIIEQAGLPAAVTIATNMAGRGTDIVLGGNLDAQILELGDNPTQVEKDKVKGRWLDLHESVLASGGLHVIGSERHESRRIDNQLRGRSGRQGDAGSTRFYLSLEDDLMRIFASDRVAGLMKKLGMEEGEAIEHPWVTRSIENAQKKVEGRNFDQRKEVLAYDDVANDQRKVIYQQRDELMDSEDVSDIITAIRSDVINDVITKYIPAKTMEEQWDISGLEKHLVDDFDINIPIEQMLKEDSQLNEEALRIQIVEFSEAEYAKKEEFATAAVMRNFEKNVMLQVYDNSWKEHLAAMDSLRQGIHFRGYAQKDPKQEYKKESFEMFTALLDHIKYEVISTLAKVELSEEDDYDDFEDTTPSEMIYEQGDIDDSEDEVFTQSSQKVGRNEACPCGSGLKYKHCHGKL